MVGALINFSLVLWINLSRLNELIGFKRDKAALSAFRSHHTNTSTHKSNVDSNY